MSFYTYDRPVSGPRYYGRQMIVRSLFDGLHRGRSFAIIGGPKVGRTSLLQQLVHRVQERWGRQPGETKVVPVVIDLADVLQAGGRFFVSHWWEAINHALSFPGVLGSQGRPNPPAINFRRSPRPWEDFRNGCAEMWEGLRGTSSWCQHALILDNADLLFDRRLDVLLEPLHDLQMKDVSWAPTCIIAAGGRYLREHLFDERAPFSKLRPMFLGPLRMNEAEALVRAGLPHLEQDWVEALVTHSGRHPYILQRMLFEMELRGTVSSLDTLIDAATEECFGLFEAIWQQMDLGRGVTYRGAYAAPEHALMQLIFDFGGGLDLKTAERELGIRPLKEYAELLEYLGVVERVLKTDSPIWVPHFELWNIWYNERILR